jgi:hypothetical protein
MQHEVKPRGYDLRAASAQLGGWSVMVGRAQFVGCDRWGRAARKRVFFARLWRSAAVKVPRRYLIAMITNG